MTAPAAPRTDFVAHESGDAEWNRSINRFGRMQAHAQILETELAATTAERDECVKWRNAINEISNLAEQRAENAEAENAALLAALEEIKGRVQFGVSMHMGSDVVKLCDAAIAKGKA